MSWRGPRLWLTVLSSAAVLWLTVGLSGESSPGPVSAVHGNIASCADCHGGWFGNMTESCLECHAPIREQIQGARGLHGALGKTKAEKCASCHSEHHGAEFAPVNRQAFLAAGVPDPQKFDHALVGYAMAGTHLEKSCVECHVNAEVALLPEGERRFIGLDKNCATCHEDAHEGKMQHSCAQCHGQVAWDQLASEGHERHLELVGGHGDLSCRTCHAQEGDHALESAGNTPRTCLDCHESPHTKEFAVESCLVCHVAVHTSFRDERLTLTSAQHARSGFALDGPHDQPACADCHKPELETFVARYPGRDAASCRACHLDVHEGQFEENCTSCHAKTHFTPHLFDAEQHGRTNFALDGSHLAAECSACHLDPVTEAPRRFAGTEQACAACHADAHAGYFGEKSCAECHTTAHFSDLPEGKFDHGRDAKFPLRGAHAQSRCEDCHLPSKERDAQGRIFGRIEGYFGCATCHVDPHEGEFDRPPHPPSLKGKRSCARCHDETSFRSFPKGFDHGFWTGFPLEGAHGKADCASCHEPLRRPTELGRTWQRAKSNACAECHNDPHSGQFLEAGVIDCARCHRSAISFADTTFRHDMDSRFALDKNHDALACAACHKAERHEGKEFIRYRPLGMLCADCHGSQADPLRRRLKESR